MRVRTLENVGVCSSEKMGSVGKKYVISVS